MSETPPCGCRSIAHDCTEAQNCRWIARLRAAARAAPPSQARLTLTDVQIDQLAADVARTTPGRGIYLLTVSSLRKVIGGAIAGQAGASAP